MNTFIKYRVPLSFAFLWFFARFAGLAAENIGQSNQLDLERTEAGLALKMAFAENIELKRKLVATEEKLVSSRGSLSKAEAQVETLRQKASEMAMRLEALGSGGIDERLLKLLNNLKIVEEERANVKRALLGLSETVCAYRKEASNGDANVQVGLEGALRDAGKALGFPPGDAVVSTAIMPTLKDGLVVSKEDDLSLVVFNLGIQHGVQIGMPFEIVRDANVIGRARVVDVRQRVAGALIQRENNLLAIRVGDLIKLASKN